MFGIRLDSDAELAIYSKSTFGTTMKISALRCSSSKRNDHQQPASSPTASNISQAMAATNVAAVALTLSASSFPFQQVSSYKF